MGMIYEHDVFVKMRDGVSLCVDVFRPEGDGRYPALLAMSPYSKEIQSMPVPPQPYYSSVYNRGIEAGDPAYFVSNGYTHVIVDVRGIGKSGGEYRGWMSDQEATDGYDLVEWMAEQPWCDGNVGMVGVSYFGAIQLSVAAKQPPHLKAIMPMNAVADFYREATYHGGILQMFFLGLYAGTAGNITAVTFEEGTPEEIRERALALAASPDIQTYPNISRLLIDPGRIPNFFDVVMHPTDGPHYWERSAYPYYDRIKIPCYFASGWWAYAHMHLRGAFQNYLGIDAPKKLFIESIVAVDAPMPDEFNVDAVRWFDHWLKGKDTGIMDEPPVRLWVMGDEQWRFENEWPLARTKWQPYYLRRWNGLSTDQESVPERPDYFVQQPVDETTTIHSLKYLTKPFGQEMEITGPMALYLHAATDQTDTNWIVALADVAPDGGEFEFTRGFLKASHRALDEERSEPWMPYHPHLEPEPVIPGEVYEYAIELSPTSIVLKPGHRLKLSITSLDHALDPGPQLLLGSGHMPWHLCSSKTTLHKIYHDLARPSHLLLPIIPRNKS